MLLIIFAIVTQAQNPGPAGPHTIQEWLDMMPQINQALDSAFPGERMRGRYPPGILQPSHVADVIGDGTSVALVSFGVGGAYTSQLALLRIAKSRPVVVRFKDRSGKTFAMVFAQGSSVMHSEAVELLPSEHALLSIHFNYGADGTLRDCGGEAYQWASASQTFDFNSGLSRKLGEAKCSRVPKTRPRF
jgi:hypothetical protein